MPVRLSVSVTATALLALAASAPLVAQVPSTEPAVLVQRVEVPGSYALTFPEGWAAYVTSETIVDRPEGRRIRLTLMADRETDAGRESCSVMHYLSEGRSLDLLAEQEIAAAREFPELLVGEPSLSTVELPLGSAVRVEYGVQYPALGVHSASYLVTDGVLVHQLSCSGPEPAADAWLSIAQTWEPLETGD